MTSIVPAPYSLKASTLKIDADQFEAGVTGVTLTPTTAVTNTVAINGANYAVVGVSTWVAAIDFLQDFETAGSLSNYLLANNGSTVEMDFYPISGGNGYTASVIIVPSVMGASGAATATATVTLTVIGQPTLISV